MAWKDLTIAQRSQLMNIMRHNGISSLSEMRRLYDLSSPSLSSLGENTFNMQPQAPVYAGGGEKKKKPLFDKEKIANRVPGDAAMPGGTEGVFSAAKNYLMNDDGYVDRRLKKAMDISREAEDPELLRTMLIHEDAKRMYLGLPQKYGSFEPSAYKPTIGKSENPQQLNALLSDEEFDNMVLPMWATWKTGKDWPLYQTGSRVKNLGNTAQLYDVPHLQNAGLSIGMDNRGQYLSLYDVWDYNSKIKNKNGDNIAKWVGGKPFDIYQRYYLDDWLDIPEEARGNPYIAPAYIESERALGGDKVQQPYTGEITQGKPFNAWDRYVANHPMAGHRVRKAGTLLADAAKFIPGVAVANTVISTMRPSDVGDLISQQSGEFPQDSAVDRLSKATTTLGAVGRASKFLMDAAKKTYENNPWVGKLGNLREDAIKADRLVNMAQFIDDFATPVEKFDNGGTEERRKVGDHYLTLEQYKELQRDTIRQAALQKALTRTKGVAPMINGKPALSCIYTFTDNYGKKYQTAGTQSFVANPSKYGFEAAGPVTEGMEGNMYLMIDELGTPYHATMITGYDKNKAPLITYSAGYAAGVQPMDRETWDHMTHREGETYERYVENTRTQGSPENDYKKNKPVWSTPRYETYRFIGTPDDNTLWEQQFNELQSAPTQVGVPQMLNNQVQLSGGGHKIHIKKANRGKFTALKKRTGHSASWFKAHGTPAQKKMAVFALNARKWKHAHGGIKF